MGVWEAVKVNSTTAYVVSNTTGSKAIYTFAGTRISVFGVVLPQDSSAGQASVYSIDGGTPTQYTAPGNATGPVYNLQFYQSSQLRDGQHTLTIVNLGDEFVVGHLEVTTDGTHIGPTSLNSGSVATTSQRPSTTSTPSSTFLPSTTTHSSTTSSISNATLTSTNSTSIVSSTFPPTNTSSATSSTLILPTSSSSPPDDAPKQNHTTTLSKGATIGGGIAGTLGFLFLVGGLCWWGQRRGRRKRQEASIPNVQKPPLGMHNVTSQMTVGSDPFASDAARRHRAPPIYIPVGSTSDLPAGGTQYTSTQGYQSEKYGAYGAYGTYDAPLYSPGSTSNLLGSPIHHAFPSPVPRLPETPVGIRRIDSDGRRRSADGGVRIAGGRPGQRMEDTGDSFLDLASRKSTGSTLPPAYDFD
ncbi:hypothetical protein GSI_08541 [Ganoderma sinense ZZ0214-1]|uniref:Uncharacterized protein n=1 Tax=Ganoderma sinense ZZ0214-1 TaxID=1077348 RepID=A0A2G8S3Z1_9APHY|nr:hypothetical protein GSI_08541 [Ganoderma sinense ZZ0214-1]